MDAATQTSAHVPGGCTGAWCQLEGTADCVRPAVLCTGLAMLYVGSLYVWRSSLCRDHPTTIRRRFVSVLFVTVLSPLFPYLHLSWRGALQAHSLWAAMGVRWSGLLQALLLPYLLTALLFLGPLVQQYQFGHWNLYLEPMYWWQSLRNMVWLRNHVVAPFSEEFTFRACMVPLLATCMPQHQLCWAAPLFFGIAHLHHLIERLNQGQPALAALAASLFQFAYTTVFGVYSAYLFVRTGHVAAPFIAHAFCNHMGFPDFAGLAGEPEPRRAGLVLTYVAGLALWYLVLSALTAPEIYGNTVYRSSTVAMSGL